GGRTDYPVSASSGRRPAGRCPRPGRVREFGRRFPPAPAPVGDKGLASMPTPVSPTANSLDVLLPAIAAGDATAFARWPASAESRLRDSLRSFAAQVDTEAVLQEALLRVWQRAPSFVPDGKPDALLRFGIRIARNLAVSELRRNRLNPMEVEELERRARE